jgi:Major Facilitator Superfamily
MLPPAGPLRRLACGALITSVGNGAWYTSWAIFLTRWVGLSAAQVGVGMTVAGALGLALATPVGDLADRVGPREVFVVLLGLQAAGSAAYLLVHGFAGFLAVACLTTVVDRAKGGARGALILGLAAGDERLRAMGSIRSLNHLGWAAGAAAGAIALGAGSRTAFAALIVLDSVTFLVYAAFAARVPRVPPVHREPGAPRLEVLRDTPYAALAVLMGVLSLCWGMLSTGLPLWLAGHTGVPVSLGALVVVANSLAIAAFQVRATRRTGTPAAAARTAVWAGTALATSCVLLAATGGRGGAPAIALVLGGGALQTLGELLFVAASWGLSIPLMPEGRTGQYQGMFATGEATAQMASPVVMTTVVVGLGRPGWLLLGAVFVLASLACVPAAGWAVRTRARAAGAASPASR